jgi:DNA-binding response OmpR family regulator
MYPQQKILVVDEDEQIAYLLDYLLSREGYRVTTITQKDQASRVIDENEPPHLVFMGDMISYADNNQIIQDITRALSAGATDFIVQPFNSAELVAQIERHASETVLQ